jgi:uncharacterized coiled-coil DUF342 family protein
VVEELQEEVSDLMTQIENIHMEARASRTKITEVINQFGSIICLIFVGGIDLEKI